MFLSPVSPADCALAIGIPQSWKEFRRDHEEHASLREQRQPAKRDFVPMLIARKDNDLKAAWEVYAPYVQVLNRVRKHVARHKVEVVTADKPSTLRPLFDQFKVITLVAHFKLAGVTPQDILDPQRVWELVQSPLDDVQQHLRHWCQQHDPGLLTQANVLPVAEAKVRVAKGIDVLVTAAHRDYQRLADWVPETGAPSPALPSPLARLTRVAFEESLGPHVLQEAGAVELRDGLFTVRELIAAIPMEFAGIIDLGLCNSVVLGGAIRRQRDRPRAIASHCLVETFVPLSRYGLVIEELAVRPQPYLEVHIRVAETAAPSQSTALPPDTNETE